MSKSPITIAVTGASGQLGRLILKALDERASGAHLIGLARKPEAIADLAAVGVEARRADYTDRASLGAALAGVERLVLVSSNEIGQRAVQHRAAIAAAKAAGVKVIVYTSILRADTSAIALAGEHRETEADIRASGIAFVFLRNGWYTENYTANAGPALQYGTVLGAAGEGRISGAPRKDYAAAAAVVAANPDAHLGKAYELGGDPGFTMPDYAAALAKQSGKPVVYKSVPEADYKAALIGFGLPEAMAAAVAQSDAEAARGALQEDGGALARLIGRPTTPLAQALAEALG